MRGRIGASGLHLGTTGWLGPQSGRTKMTEKVSDVRRAEALSLSIQSRCADALSGGAGTTFITRLFSMPMAFWLSTRPLGLPLSHSLFYPLSLTLFHNAFRQLSLTILQPCTRRVCAGGGQKARRPNSCYWLEDVGLCERCGCGWHHHSGPCHCSSSCNVGAARGAGGR
jgi:hypothetical protein